MASDMEERLIPDRQAMRRLVAREFEIYKQFEAAGENTHQLMLDLNEMFEERIAHYSDQEQEILRDIRIQEITAVFQHDADMLQNEAIKLQGAIAEREIELDSKRWEIAETNRTWEAVGGGIGLIVLLTIIMTLFK